MRGCWSPEWHLEKTGSRSVLDNTQNTMDRPVVTTMGKNIYIEMAVLAVSQYLLP